MCDESELGSLCFSTTKLNMIQSTDTRTGRELSQGYESTWTKHDFLGFIVHFRYHPLLKMVHSSLLFFRSYLLLESNLRTTHAMNYIRTYMYIMWSL